MRPTDLLREMRGNAAWDLTKALFFVAGGSVLTNVPSLIHHAEIAPWIVSALFVFAWASVAVVGAWRKPWRQVSPGTEVQFAKLNIVERAALRRLNEAKKLKSQQVENLIYEADLLPPPPYDYFAAIDNKTSFVRRDPTGDYIIVDAYRDEVAELVKRPLLL